MESSARVQDLPGSRPTISGTLPAQLRAGVCLRPEAASTGRSCPLRRLSLGLARGRRLGTSQPGDGLAHALSLRLELSQVPLQLGDSLLTSPEAPLEAALVAATVASATTTSAATSTAVVAVAGAVAAVVATAAAPTPVFVAVTVVRAAAAATSLAVMMTLAHRTTSLTVLATFPDCTC